MSSKNPNLVLLNTPAMSTTVKGGGTGGNDMEQRMRSVEATLAEISVTLARLDERSKDAPTKTWFYTAIVPVYSGLFITTLLFLKWLLTPDVIAAIIGRLAQ